MLRTTSLVFNPTTPHAGPSQAPPNPPRRHRRYESDLIEEDVILKWHKQAVGHDDAAGKKVREAAAPFIKWLHEAEEQASAGEEGEEGPLPYAS